MIRHLACHYLGELSYHEWYLAGDRDSLLHFRAETCQIHIK